MDYFKQGVDKDSPLYRILKPNYQSQSTAAPAMAQAPEIQTRNQPYENITSKVFNQNHMSMPVYSTRPSFPYGASPYSGSGPMPRPKAHPLQNEGTYTPAYKIKNLPVSSSTSSYGLPTSNRYKFSGPCSSSSKPSVSCSQSYPFKNPKTYRSFMPRGLDPESSGQEGEEGYASLKPQTRSGPVPTIIKPAPEFAKQCSKFGILNTEATETLASSGTGRRIRGSAPATRPTMPAYGPATPGYMACPSSFMDRQMQNPTTACPSPAQSPTCDPYPYYSVFIPDQTPVVVYPSSSNGAYPTAPPVPHFNEYQLPPYQYNPVSPPAPRFPTHYAPNIPQNDMGALNNEAVYGPAFEPNPNCLYPANPTNFYYSPTTYNNNNEVHQAPAPAPAQSQLVDLFIAGNVEESSGSEGSTTGALLREDVEIVEIVSNPNISDTTVKPATILKRDGEEPGYSSSAEVIIIKERSNRRGQSQATDGDNSETTTFTVSTNKPDAPVTVHNLSSRRQTFRIWNGGEFYPNETSYNTMSPVVESDEKMSIYRYVSQEEPVQTSSEKPSVLEPATDSTKSQASEIQASTKSQVSDIQASSNSNESAKCSEDADCKSFLNRASYTIIASPTAAAAAAAAAEAKSGNLKKRLKAAILASPEIDWLGEFICNYLLDDLIFETCLNVACGLPPSHNVAALQPPKIVIECCPDLELEMVEESDPPLTDEMKKNLLHPDSASMVGSTSEPEEVAMPAAKPKTSLTKMLKSKVALSLGPTKIIKPKAAIKKKTSKTFVKQPAATKAKTEAAPKPKPMAKAQATQGYQTPSAEGHTTQEAKGKARAGQFKATNGNRVSDSKHKGDLKDLEDEIKSEIVHIQAQRPAVTDTGASKPQSDCYAGDKKSEITTPSLIKSDKTTGKSTPAVGKLDPSPVKAKQTQVKTGKAKVPKLQAAVKTIISHVRANSMDLKTKGKVDLQMDLNATASALESVFKSNSSPQAESHSPAKTPPSNPKNIDLALLDLLQDQLSRPSVFNFNEAVERIMRNSALKTNKQQMPKNLKFSAAKFEPPIKPGTLEVVQKASSKFMRSLSKEKTAVAPQSGAANINADESEMLLNALHKATGIKAASLSDVEALKKMWQHCKLNPSSNSMDEYLNENLMPSLTKALETILRDRPSDPSAALALLLLLNKNQTSANKSA